MLQVRKPKQGVTSGRGRISDVWGCCYWFVLKRLRNMQPHNSWSLLSAVQARILNWELQDIILSELLLVMFSIAGVFETTSCSIFQRKTAAVLLVSVKTLLFQRKFWLWDCCRRCVTSLSSGIGSLRLQTNQERLPVLPGHPKAFLGETCTEDEQRRWAETPQGPEPHPQTLHWWTWSHILQTWGTSWRFFPVTRKVQFLFLSLAAAATMSLTPAVPVSLLGLLLLLGLASSQTVSPSVEDLSNRNADFAARLYRAVAKRTDDNVFLSPLALSTALSALLSSTSGWTRDQLLQGLTLTELDPQTLPGRLGFQEVFTPLYG